MNDPTKDNALSRIYREGAWPEPGRQIDQAILAASRRAAREHSFVRRWAPSFAIAATVVLTSTLVLKAYREQPEVVSPSVTDNQPEPRAKQGPTAPEPKVAEAKAAAAPPAPATPRGFTSTMDAGEAERLDRLRNDLGLKQSPPPSESQVPAPKSELVDKAAAASLKKETATRAEASQRRSDNQQPAATPREQPPASVPISVFGAPPPAPVQQQPLRAAKPAAQNALPIARPEPVQPQAPSAISAETSAPAPSPAASADSAPSNAPAAAVAARIASKASERSPQTWIEDIRKLIADGRLEQADRELADFKKRYPDYVLPGDMR